MSVMQSLIRWCQARETKATKLNPSKVLVAIVDAFISKKSYSVFDIDDGARSPIIFPTVT